MTLNNSGDGCACNSSRIARYGFQPSCVDPLELIVVINPELPRALITLAVGLSPNATLSDSVRRTISRAGRKTLSACCPVVAPMMICAPGSSSQHRQYSAIAAAIVDLANFRAAEMYAVENRRPPSARLQPNSVVRMN